MKTITATRQTKSDVILTAGEYHAESLIGRAHTRKTLGTLSTLPPSTRTVSTTGPLPESEDTIIPESHIRGPYRRHSPQTRVRFLQDIKDFGKKLAYEQYKHIPTTTLDTWRTKPRSNPPPGKHRNPGGGKSPAYSKAILSSQLVSPLLERRNISTLSYESISKMAMKHLGSPSSQTFPDFCYSREWVRKTVLPKIKWSMQERRDVKSEKVEPPALIEKQCVDMLKEVYEFRVALMNHIGDGKLATEQILSLTRMGYFDELKEPFEPPADECDKSANPISGDMATKKGAGQQHANYTIGIFTRADGEMGIPMVIFDGLMQPFDQSLKTVYVHDKFKVRVKRQVFVAHNESHNNNEFLYAAYLKACIFPDLPTRDCCENPDCKLYLFIDDRAPCHWSEHVKNTFKTVAPQVLRVVCPNTKFTSANVTLYACFMLPLFSLLGSKREQTSEEENQQGFAGFP